MNKNIKFYNFEDNKNIKIIGKHSANTDDNFENCVNNYDTDYAIATEDNFEEVLSSILKKLSNKYNKTGLQYIIRLGTIFQETQMVKSNTNLFSLPFKSNKTIFIDANQFNIDIHNKNVEEKDIDVYINFLAFIKNSNKEILEAIVFLNYNTSSKDINLDIRLRKDLLFEKDNKTLANNEMYKFKFSYFCPTPITNIFKDPFEIIRKTMYNINNLLNYKRRDKIEKELYENMNNKVIIPNNITKFSKQIFNLDKKYKVYLQTVLEEIAEFKNADELLQKSYKEIIPILSDTDKLILSFSKIQNTYNISKLKDDEISMDPFFYTLNVFPIKPDNKEKKLAVALKKTMKFMKKAEKLSGTNTLIPINVGIAVTENNTFEFKIDLELSMIVFDKQKLNSSKDICLKSLEFNKIIDLGLYYIKENYDLYKPISYEDMIAKELINKIDQLEDKSIYSFIDILFNKNILNKILCDCYYFTDNWNC